MCVGLSEASIVWVRRPGVGGDKGPPTVKTRGTRPQEKNRSQEERDSPTNAEGQRPRGLPPTFRLYTASEQHQRMKIAPSAVASRQRCRGRQPSPLTHPPRHTPPPARVEGKGVATRAGREAGGQSSLHVLTCALERPCGGREATQRWTTASTGCSPQGATAAGTASTPAVAPPVSAAGECQCAPPQHAPTAGTTTTTTTTANAATVATAAAEVSAATWCARRRPPSAAALARKPSGKENMDEGAEGEQSWRSGVPVVWRRGVSPPS